MTATQPPWRVGRGLWMMRSGYRLGPRDEGPRDDAIAITARPPRGGASAVLGLDDAIGISTRPPGEGPREDAIAITARPPRGGASAVLGVG